MEKTDSLITMKIYDVVSEKLSGTRQLNYAVTDTINKVVIARYADKKVADDLAAKLNERRMEGEGE